MTTARERLLAAQLGAAQGQLPRLQLEAIHAATLKDQAEALLRIAQGQVTEVTAVLDTVLDAADGDYAGLPDGIKGTLHGVDPDRYPLA